ncbi:MAG: glycosyltransferase [Bacteroidia bacterium]|nr:glycosyltransferase [Bacteroidia bacterium]
MRRIAFFANYKFGSVSYFALRALRSIVEEVVAFSPDVLPNNEENIILCPILAPVKQILTEMGGSFDAVIVVETNQFPLLLVTDIQGLEIPIAWWGIDTHLHFRWHKEYTKLFDYVFLAQLDYVYPVSRYAGMPVHWLPLAADPDFHNDYYLDRVYDVSFVGNISPKRQRFFRKLSAQTPVHLFSGKSPVELGQIYSQSKIGLNSITYEDLNARIFEVMACGALLITPETQAGLPNLFIPNKQLVTYSKHTLENTIKHYLIDRVAREEIALEGFHAVHTAHTYEKRCLQMLDIIANGKTKKKSDCYLSPEVEIALAWVYQHRYFRYYPKSMALFRKNLLLHPFTTIQAMFRYVIAYGWQKWHRFKAEK